MGFKCPWIGPTQHLPPQDESSSNFGLDGSFADVGPVWPIASDMHNAEERLGNVPKKNGHRIEMDSEFARILTPGHETLTLGHELRKNPLEDDVGDG